MRRYHEKSLNDPLTIDLCDGGRYRNVDSGAVFANHLNFHGDCVLMNYNVPEQLLIASDFFRRMQKRLRLSQNFVSLPAKQFLGGAVAVGQDPDSASAQKIASPASSINSLKRDSLSCSDASVRFRSSTSVHVPYQPEILPEASLTGT